MTKKKFLLHFPVIILSLVLLNSCSEQPRTDHVLSGWTMGTYYRITLMQVTPGQIKSAQSKVNNVLDKINQSMSVFEPGSEISRFNEIPAGRKLCVSPDFAEVMRISFKVYEMTDKAFDPTVAPLIELWGFGTDKSVQDFPHEDQIKKILPSVGLDKILMDEKGCLVKKHPHTSLNLSGVAKGYAVDLIARAMEDLKINSYLVDIGGDMYAGQAKPDGTAWRIGISAPLPQAGAQDYIETAEITNQALATSGDYRNYFIKDNIRYSHIIDPATGYPVRQNIVSATVKADNCALADALATAMLIMDKDQALQLSTESEIFEVLLIQMVQDEEISVHSSFGFTETGK
ncbi:MAG: FAD:protein FMN transferase [Desulfonatronovibrio sp. MSAO_Bac4]|nr:MAG: FAD:protein FMN transferase [Desulfonatronovibrio sp. MSAO_Bac4]